MLVQKKDREQFKVENVSIPANPETEIDGQDANEMEEEELAQADDDDKKKMRMMEKQ